ncbi:MAG: histidine phosphotransferase family protein [Paracoccus sp. (in: a-proteobacteria)]|nr:histidine phosphotransferase family protein [Paracoccus sp. (in: a-proteobacteria)]
MSLHSTPLGAGELAALVGSRLCHDLVSPLGAIGNGLELLQMSPEFTTAAEGPEMSLISEAVAAARARIDSFRMAFGQATGDQRIALGQLRQLARNTPLHGRTEIDLNGPTDVARADARMLLLAVMCMDHAMPRGGRVLIVHHQPGWQVVAECSRARIEPGLWAWIGAGGTPQTPRPGDVQFALLAHAAADAGRRLRAEIDETGAEITF